MLEYPWGISGGVGIKGEDFDQLRPGVYLNDNLIEFGLWCVFLKVFFAHVNILQASARSIGTR